MGGLNLTGTAEFSFEFGTVLNNLANGNGGGIQGLDLSSVLLESQALVTGNVSFSDGGGLAIVHSASLNGPDIDNNTSYGLGGGLACLDCQSLNISGASVISNNDAEFGGGLALQLADGVVADIQGLDFARQHSRLFWWWQWGWYVPRLW